MSGEVRKRKDKKKRKDDAGDGLSFSQSNEDVNIHVYKEGSTGGNFCAKIVFVLLFSALIVLVGLIIKENQGLNELENVEVESRFSQIFDGWVEKNSDEHEDSHSPEILHSHEDDEDDDDDDHQYESEEQTVEESEQEESQEYEEPDESTPQSDEEDDSTIEESTEKTEEEYDDDDDESNADREDESEEQLDKDSEQLEEDSEQFDEDNVEPDEVDSEIEASKEKEDEIEKPVENNVKEVKDEDVKDAPPQASTGHINVGEESQSEGEEYEPSDITNAEDYKIKDELDRAQEQLKENTAYANKLFEALIQQYPFSPRALYGKAQALDILAEQKQRNDLLQQALNYYLKALDIDDIPDHLYQTIADRYIDRARFMGQYNKALSIHWKLIQKFPDNPIYLNNLAVTYLTVNYVDEARSVLKKVLARWPTNGFALVHYGFILKTNDNLLQESVDYISRGLKTKAEGVVDGRFYFHLGDALSRLNKPDEAMTVYEEGVRENVFMSKYQRSLYNVPRLTGRPWWKPEDLPAYSKLFIALKDNWHNIRREGLAALNSQGYFQDEAENLKDTGIWKQFELFARGRKYKKNCEKSPITCGIIQSFPDASSCKRGQTKFSVMHPNTHVWPHCGPTNCRLRVHLGLKIPPDTFIRVAEDTRSWKEGDIIIFDDSFEHEVWHNGSEFRLVLIVDIWHPELTTSEKMNLSYI